MGWQNDWDGLAIALKAEQEREEMRECLPAYFLGLDLGQAADYSALAILERQLRSSIKEPPIFHCRHLQRWPLRTSYPQIVDDTARIVAGDQIQNRARDFGASGPGGGQDAHTPVLAVDAMGVGAPVVDLFKKRLGELRGDLRQKVGVSLRPILITGGDSVTVEQGITRVPKRELVSAAQVALQTARLKIAAELPEARTLTRELQSFQVKISLDTAHDSYGAWREGAHDDLVLAVALALWIAQNDKVRRVVYA